MDTDNGFLLEQIAANTDLTDLKRTALVVDDDHTNRMLAKLTLESAGYNVFLAVDGLDAIRQYKENRPHVVFMDIEMPNLGGYDASREIRTFEDDNRLPRTPIAAFTTLDEKKVQIRMSDYGITGYVQKPFSPLKVLKFASKSYR